MRHNICLLLGLIGLGFSLPGHTGELPVSFTECRSINDPSQRLACYDEAIDVLSPTVKQEAPAQQVAAKPVEKRPEAESLTVVESKAVATVTAPVVANSEDVAEAFGKEHLRNKAADKPDEKPDSFASQVVTIRRDAYKKKIVTLANGQVWKLTEKQLRLKAGDAISISRGMLNSYFIGKPDSNKKVRVKRLK